MMLEASAIEFGENDATKLNVINLGECSANCKDFADIKIGRVTTLYLQ